MTVQLSALYGTRSRWKTEDILALGPAPYHYAEKYSKAKVVLELIGFKIIAKRELG